MSEMDKCICGGELPVITGPGRPAQYCSERCANKHRKQRQRERDAQQKHVTEIQRDVTEIQGEDTNRVQLKAEMARILPYPGAKWKLAAWIVSHFPEHKTYLEPYAGSAAVFFSKVPAPHEILGDMNGDLINLFQVVQEQGQDLARRIALTGWIEEEYQMYKRTYSGSGDRVEDARRFLIRCWQSHGVQLGKVSGWRHNGVKGNASTVELWNQLPDRIQAVIQRLKRAEIRNRPALELIEYYNAPDCLIYADPPYLLSTRLSEGHYIHEMTDADHRALLEALDKHKGPVALSGYAHPIYDERLSHWQRVTIPTIAEHARPRVEVLWLNQKAAQVQQQSLFDVS